MYLVKAGLFCSELSRLVMKYSTLAAGKNRAATLTLPIRLGLRNSQLGASDSSGASTFYSRLDAPRLGRLASCHQVPTLLRFPFHHHSIASSSTTTLTRSQIYPALSIAELSLNLLLFSLFSLSFVSRCRSNKLTERSGEQPTSGCRSQNACI